MINSHTLQRNIRLDRHTSIGLGGDVDYFWTVVKSDDLPNVLEEVYALGHSPFILGGGSNLVVSDAGVQGSVVTSTSARPPVFGDEVVVDGGYEWDRFVADAVLAGWSGVELMSGIPGKVGAAPIQNIGAYGQEVSEVIQWVEVLWLDTLSVEVFDNASCEFAYRTSVFKALYSGRLIVTRVAFRLNRVEEVELQYKDLVERLGPRCTPQVGRQAVLKIRADKGMTLNHGHGYSSAGSFFMNPVIGRTQFEGLAEAAGGQIPSWSVGDNEVKLAAAWLIERAGFQKGERRGCIGISPRHALSLVNFGGGHTTALLELALEIQTRVFEVYGVWLTMEPVLLGEGLVRFKRLKSETPLKEP